MLAHKLKPVYRTCSAFQETVLNGPVSDLSGDAQPMSINLINYLHGIWRSLLVPSDRMISDVMKHEACGCGCDVIPVVYYSRIYLERPRKTTKVSVMVASLHALWKTRSGINNKSEPPATR